MFFELVRERCNELSKVKDAHVIGAQKPGHPAGKPPGYQGALDDNPVIALDDIVQGYYAGGYPPAGEGVCTDVIWPAFQAAGNNLKGLVDEDIRRNVSAYPAVKGRPDPNIDFRRVRNLTVFFQRHDLSLPLEVRPGDASNLVQWQGGNIMVFAPPFEHITIVSDRRRRDGVPYLLHNAGPVAGGSDGLLNWPSPITNHFRFPPMGRPEPERPGA